MIYKPSKETEAIEFVKESFAKKKWLKIDHIPEAKTVNQVRYIWLVFTLIAEDVGCYKDDIYSYYLDKFPVYKTINKKGIDIDVRVSMSKFSKDQEREFIDKVVIDARQEGYIIPDPEDKKVIEMYNYYRKKGLI